jgi:thiol-disulfide isomerase/thioredoxin
VGFLGYGGVFIFILSSFLSCARHMDTALGQPPTNSVPEQASGAGINSVVTDVDGGAVTLEPASDRPRLILFASLFCSVCQKEHIALRDLMKAHGNLRPANVELLTIMTGAIDSTDSLDFQDFTGIGWTPYYQDGDELRNSLCGKGTPNPCVVVEVPRRGVIFQKIGEVSIDELQQLTGPWRW